MKAKKQTDLLNETHPSTLICPITTNIQTESELLRVHLKKGQLEAISDIQVDQIRAFDNRRLLRRLSQLTKDQESILKANLRIILDL